MACNLATVQAAACTSGIGKETDPIKLLQAAAQSLATRLDTVSALPVTVDAILARACTSGIARQTDPLALLRIYAQNLCNQIGQTPVAACNAITLSGAGTSSANAVYVKQSSTQYDILPLHSSPNSIRFNSASGLWEVVNSISGVLYVQNGSLPTNWTTVVGGDPSPTGVCS